LIVVLRYHVWGWTMTPDTRANFDAAAAALARSNDFRRSKSCVWHVVDVTRNVVLPTAGLAWICHDLWIGTARFFDAGLFVTSLFAIGLGMTVGLHRYFSHRSFSARSPLKCALAILGSMAWQRPLFMWAARHRLHHHHADSAGDYHSPHVLFDGTGIHAPWRKALHAHYAWLHIADPIDAAARQLTSDLRSDPFLVWCDRNYNFLCFASVLIPSLVGLWWYGSILGAVKGAMWGGLGPIAAVHHLTWIVNSACHLTGYIAYATKDESHNISPLGWLVFGEGYHNNHHAFPYSPRMGFDRWQVDIGWQFIRLCERLGLAYDLKPVPSVEQRNRRRYLAHRPATAP
jgi:stearoyl-CoA desaturase (delta-9 desaturase)